MEQSFDKRIRTERPGVLARSLALMKPVTWFAPMWAFLCGAIASGATGWNLPDIGRIVLGVIMAGPILLGLSQVINDYFDREVDALNEPDRLIPAGMVSLGQVILTVVVLTPFGIAIAFYLGRPVAMLAAAGLLLAFVYSAPPFRAKRNGWFGNTVAAISYEALPWLAGHVAFGQLTPESVLVVGLYSFGTHGIMSINDYKSIEGDKKAGIKTVPVQLGEVPTSRLIVTIMDLAQIGVITAFLMWGRPVVALALGIILLVQVPIQKKFLGNPTEMYLKFSAIGVSFFVWGMMAAAIGLRTL